jgi:hypothetical protein
MNKLNEMSDEELEHCLKNDRAYPLDDDGFTESTLAKLPTISRKSKPNMVLIMLLLGCGLCLLLPSGVQALMGAFQELMNLGSSTTINPEKTLMSLLIVFLPLGLIFALGISLVMDEQ